MEQLKGGLDWRAHVISNSPSVLLVIVGSVATCLDEAGGEVTAEALFIKTTADMVVSYCWACECSSLQVGSALWSCYQFGKGRLQECEVLCQTLQTCWQKDLVDQIAQVGGSKAVDASFSESPADKYTWNKRAAGGSGIGWRALCFRMD